MKYWRTFEENKKQSNMKTIEFTLEGINELGRFTTKRKCKTDSLSNEDIFRDCWNSLPKRLSNWEAISFENEGEKITTCKHWLEETGLDWSQSHEIETL